MADDAPEPVHEKNALLRHLLTLIIHRVVDLETFRLGRPPEHRLTACLAEHLPLNVSPVVEEHAQDADGKQHRRRLKAELGRSFYRARHVVGVHRRHEDEAAPGLHEAAVVFNDVDRAHIANLPPEELDQVKVSQCRAEHEPVVQLTMLLEGSSRRRDAIDHPERHREAAVDDFLDVDAEDLRVQLDSRVVVVQEALAAICDIGGRRVRAAFDVQVDAEDEGADVQDGQHLQVLVKQDRQRVITELGAADEERCEDEGVLHAVVGVAGHVARRR